MRPLPVLLSTLGAAAVVVGVRAQAPPEIPRVPFDRYQLHAEVGDTLKKWQAAFPKLAKLYSIGKSYQGRDLWLLEVTNGDTGPGEAKPAIWLDGGTHSDEPCGRPMVMYTAQTLLLGFGHDAAITELVNTRTFYILPQVNPDGTEHWLTKPGIMSHAMPWDDDRDGLVDEDPADDLNGDGKITLMRVKDDTGPLKRADADARLLEPRGETEKGEFRTYVEGTDNDGDGAFNEDRVGGVNVNRTFPYQWNPAQSGSGFHPLCVPESRAIVEFMTAHPNITGTFSVHGGGWPLTFVVRPPADGPDDTLPEFDFSVYQTLEARLKEITGGNPVTSTYNNTIMGGNRPRGASYGYGIFGPWAYHALGLYSFTPEASGIDADTDGDGRVSELEMLRWSDTKKGGAYYVDWKPFNHPQLGPVEIGGWVQKIAPIDAGLEKLCRDYAQFNIYQASLSPLLRIRSVTEKPVANGVFTVQAIIANIGFLPTYVSQAALAARRDNPILVTVAVEGGELVSGAPRAVVGHLAGNAPASPGYFLFSGGSAALPAKTLEWIVKARPGTATKVTVTAASAKAGRDTRTVELR
jgi:hypothetical protein